MTALKKSQCANLNNLNQSNQSSFIIKEGTIKMDHSFNFKVYIVVLNQ